MPNVHLFSGLVVPEMLAHIRFLCKIFLNNLWSACSFLELHSPFDLCALESYIKCKDMVIMAIFMPFCVLQVYTEFLSQKYLI